MLLKDHWQICHVYSGRKQINLRDADKWTTLCITADRLNRIFNAPAKKEQQFAVI